MSIDQIPQRCSNCRFFLASLTEEHVMAEKGTCRRYPPTRDNHFYESMTGAILYDGRWEDRPHVQADEWCGEWQYYKGFLDAFTESVMDMFNNDKDSKQKEG